MTSRTTKRCFTVNQGYREFPFGNSRESLTPKIQGGNSQEFLKFWRELREFTGVLFLKFFSIVDYE